MVLARAMSILAREMVACAGLGGYAWLVSFSGR